MSVVEETELSKNCPQSWNSELKLAVVFMKAKLMATTGKITTRVVPQESCGGLLHNGLFLEAAISFFNEF